MPGASAAERGILKKEAHDLAAPWAGAIGESGDVAGNQRFQKRPRPAERALSARMSRLNSGIPGHKASSQGADERGIRHGTNATEHSNQSDFV
jgi:hypothetical protein